MGAPPTRLVNGIHIVETLKFDQLRPGQTTFILEPLNTKGGTGSTIAPIAAC
jgi:kynurenine formamidase